MWDETSSKWQYCIHVILYMVVAQYLCDVHTMLMWYLCDTCVMETQKIETKKCIFLNFLHSQIEHM
jgi:hypothetical protein